MSQQLCATPARKQHATETCPLTFPEHCLGYPRKFDVLWRRGGPSSSGHAMDIQTTALPGSHHAIAARARLALPTVPERRLTAGSGSAAAIPTLIGVSLSQHCPGRRRHPTWGPWPSSERSAGPATPSTPCSTRSSPSTWRSSCARWRRPATARPAAVRRARIPGVSDVRRVGTGRGAVSVRGLRPRALRAVLLQGPRLLPELRGRRKLGYRLNARMPRRALALVLIAIAIAGGTKLLAN